MKVLTYSVLLASWLSTGVAIADPTGSSATTSNDPKSRIVCKEVQVTGSLLPGPRICHTKAEWDEIQRQSEATLREVQDNGANTIPGK
jgi:hypothetical protein